MTASENLKRVLESEIRLLQNYKEHLINLVDEEKQKSLKAKQKLIACCKNSADKIQNQREQLKACNEKIKMLNCKLSEATERADKYQQRLDALLGTYEACAREDTEKLLNEAIPVFCDKYCRYPLECKSQDELDEHCDNCEFIKILNMGVQKTE